MSPSRFYGGMLILVCLLYAVPVGWVLAGLNSAIFLWNKDFCRGEFILFGRSKLLTLVENKAGAKFIFSCGSSFVGPMEAVPCGPDAGLRGSV